MRCFLLRVPVPFMQKVSLKVSISYSVPNISCLFEFWKIYIVIKFKIYIDAFHWSIYVIIAIWISILDSFHSLSHGCKIRIYLDYSSYVSITYGDPFRKIIFFLMVLYQIDNAHKSAFRGQIVTYCNICWWVRIFQ